MSAPHQEHADRADGSMDRRAFLGSAGAAASAAGVLGQLPGCEEGAQSQAARPMPTPAEWRRIREQFVIDPQWIHLGGMLLAPHPRAVRESIARHRAGLDVNPVGYLNGHRGRLRREVREAAAKYIGGEARDIALTDSTTMGIGLVYNGVRIGEGQEMLTSEHDYFQTRNALGFKAGWSGASVRQIRLYDDVRTASAEQIVDNIFQAITPRSRVLAATWVHSKTGLKLPVQQIADRLRAINADRSPEQRVLFCLDGVHGFGVEQEQVTELGCDFFFAGTHKWIFAPRGTGIIWGRPEVQRQVRPTIPTFITDDTWGGSMSPGGFKPFEHQWAMTEAFEFHEALGKAAVCQRIHALARQLKEGLEGIDGVTLHTPMDEDLSSGIVCFEVDGMTPREVVNRLHERNIIASVTPYTPPYARFSPGLLNTEQEVETTIEAVRAIA